MEEKYQCHICMEVAQKPVVTPCGHLFCWACIYHWLRSNQEYLTCPICKSGLDMNSLRPILIPDQPAEKAQFGLPPRPRPHRKPKHQIYHKNIPSSIASIGMNIQRGVLLAGYGLFPSAYMCLFQNHVPSQQTGQLGQPSIQHTIQTWAKVACIAIGVISTAIIIIG